MCAKNNQSQKYFHLRAFLILFATLITITVGCDNKDAQILVLVSNSGEMANNFFPKVGSSLETYFPGSKFAVASYSRNSCLEVVLQFTTNADDVSKVKLNGTGGSPTSSVLKAIELASSTNKIPWSEDKQALKIIIVFVSGNPGGNSQCETAPTVSTLANQLKEFHIKLVLFFEDTFVDLALSDFTSKLVEEKVQLYQLPFVEGDIGTVADSIEVLSEAHCEVVSPSSKAGSGETCDSIVESKATLQIAFLVDRTLTFKKFFKQFASSSVGLIRRLQGSYPGSQFALVTFADYAYSQMKYASKQNTDEKHGCFKVYKSLTSDASAFSNAANEVRAINGGDGLENALGGIFLTVTNKKLGWSDKSIDKNGNPLQKIIILLTDQDTKTISYNANFKDLSKRRKPKGDGSDNCENSLIPSFGLVGEAFRMRSIIPLAFVNKTVMARWKAHFGTKMGIDNARISLLDLDNTDGLVQSIEKVVKTTVSCIWETDPPGLNTFGL